MSTSILDFKTAVARQLGKSNANTNVPKRDGAIGEAIAQYTDERPWSWNEATASISNSDSLPSDYTETFPPKAYTYVNGHIQDIEFVAYPYLAVTQSPAFATSGGKLYTNVTTTINLLYHKKAQVVEIDGTDNATSLVFGITTPVKLAIALYWLSAERDEANYDRFQKEYERLLSTDKNYDRRIKRYEKPAKRTFLGWNKLRA